MIKKRISLFNLKKTTINSSSESPPPLPSPTATTHASASTSSTSAATSPSTSRPRPYRHETDPLSSSTPSSRPSKKAESPTSAHFNFPAQQSASQSQADGSKVRSTSRPRGRVESLEGRSHNDASLNLQSAEAWARRRPRSGSEPATHNRTRSHFSIPDICITGCEEEGEEEHFEVQFAEDQRRTQLHTALVQPASPVEPVPRKSLSGMMRPFMQRFDSESSKTFSSSVNHEPQSAHSPAPRARKSSLPLLFGKKDAAATAAAATVSKQQSQDCPSSPYGTNGSACDSTGSLPWSTSHDSLPSSSSDHQSTPVTPPAYDGAPTYAHVDYSSLPASAIPLTLPKTMSKKERKAREKEEQAFLKEVRRLDKLVREHDAKSDKKTPKKTTSVKLFGSPKKGSASTSVFAGPELARGDFSTSQDSLALVDGRPMAVTARAGQRHDASVDNFATGLARIASPVDTIGSRDSLDSDGLSFSPRDWDCFPSLEDANGLTSLASQDEVVDTFDLSIDDVDSSLAQYSVSSQPLAHAEQKSTCPPSQAPLGATVRIDGEETPRAATPTQRQRDHNLRGGEQRSTDAQREGVRSASSSVAPCHVASPTSAPRRPPRPEETPKSLPSTAPLVIRNRAVDACQ